MMVYSDHRIFMSQHLLLSRIAAPIIYSVPICFPVVARNSCMMINNINFFLKEMTSNHRLSEEEYTRSIQLIVTIFIQCLRCGCQEKQAEFMQETHSAADTIKIQTSSARHEVLSRSDSSKATRPRRIELNFRPEQSQSLNHHHHHQ